MSRACFSLLAVSVWAAGGLSVFAGGAYDEYQRACQLDSQGNTAQAKAIYEQMLATFPNDPLSGPDYAGFKLKLLAMRSALAGGDTAGAKVIAEQIRSLPSSAKEKPGQLYWTGLVLEERQLYSEALSFYNEVGIAFTDNVFAGPDYAAFRVKYLAIRSVLAGGDTAVVKVIAEQIRSLPSSAKEKPGQLYWTGLLLEERQLYSEALSFYNEVGSAFTDNVFAGPDYAAFRVKYLAIRSALAGGDTAGAKVIAEQIRSLPSSAKEKPGQLYWTGLVLEERQLYSEALSFYNEVGSAFTDNVFAGPDYAAFRVKYLAIRSALAGGDTAGAKVIAEQIRSLPSSAKEKPGQLYWTGLLLEEKKLWDETLSMYRQIAAEYPDSSVAKKAAIRGDGIAALQAIERGETAVALSATAALKTAYAASPAECAEALFAIGEAYYLAGLSRGTSDPNTDLFLKNGVALFVNDIQHKIADKQCEASVQHMIGYGYLELGEYKKAAEACIKVTDTDPNYRSAWQSLLTASICYEKLAADGNMPQSDADNAIRGCYKRILEKYPACPSPIKQSIGSWLKQHEPQDANSISQVLSPQEWVGKKLPVLGCIDIGEKIAKGQWLLVFYHFDCPECLAAIKRIQSCEKELMVAGQQIALIEVPPYGAVSKDTENVCVWAKLSQEKQWIMETPIVIKIRDGIVTSCGKNV